MLATVLLVIHLMIAAALVGVVLLQRSEGGALGIGGGGGFLTGRDTANLLTRTTAVLAAAFFATSILLTLSAQRTSRPESVFGREPPGVPAKTGPAVPMGEPLPPQPTAPAAGGLNDKLPPIPQSK